MLALHPHASGYELHQVIEESTGYMLRASFSFLDEGAVDMEMIHLVWESMGRHFAQKLAARREWLADLREQVEERVA